MRVISLDKAHFVQKNTRENNPNSFGPSSHNPLILINTMSFLFPDAARIANIGHVNTVSILSTDQLRDYVVYVRMSRDSLFTDAFTYTYDGVKISCPDQGSGRQFVNGRSLCDAFCDPRTVNIHHGSQHVFFKHAFKIGDPVSISSTANLSLEGHTRNSNTLVQIYAVFMNALDGSPMPSWSINPDDGAVEVLYEYYSNGTGFLNTPGSAADSVIADSLGVPGFKSGSLISGGGSLLVNGMRQTCTSNIASLTNNGPSILGVNSSVINDCIWNDRPNPTTVRLVRALDRNVQTLVFATICEQASPTAGVTDVFAILRCVPGIVSANNAVPALTCSASSSADSAIVFEDQGMSYASPSHPVYLRKLLTMTPYSQADPWRAKRMRFPPIEVAFTTSVGDAVIADGKRKLSPAHVHKTMPAGGLGTRLLQLASVVCRGDYDNERCVNFDLDRAMQNVHDINASLAKQVDLSQEPTQTHECICDSINGFFDDTAKRVAFLNEFNAKFPGVLTSPSIAQSAYSGIPFNRALALAMDNRIATDVSLCVFLTIDFCIPEDLASMEAKRFKTNRLNGVPIIFCLS